MSQRIANIVATGCYVPEKLVTNAELKERFTELGLPDVIDKFEASSSVKQRWYAPEDWATSDLAVEASKNALERAGLTAADIDLIVLGTDSPDFITPATSVVVQKKLGAENAGTYDVGCACASFPTALATASGLIATNPNINRVLVIGVYMMHKLGDPNDPMIFFYGDGAGAAILEAGEEQGFMGTAMQADGTYHKAWGIYAGGTAEPATEDAVKSGRTKVQVLDRYPPEINDIGWPKLMKKMADAHGISLDDVDHYIFTQVRKPTIELALENVGQPPEKAHMVMEKWGYTGSACIPMAFHDAVEEGKIKKGDLVMFIGSGVGYNQAASLFRMTADLKK